jgi:hypothetical protein
MYWLVGASDAGCRDGIVPHIFAEITIDEFLQEIKNETLYGRSLIGLAEV